MTSTIQKWGNSLGVRIPKAIARSANFDPGTQVEIAIDNGVVTIKPVDVPSLADLLKQIKRGDKPPVFDWGKPVGKEVW